MRIRHHAYLLIIGPLAALALVACGQTTLSDEQHFERGLEKYGSREFRSAVIEFKNALQQNPEHLGARLHLARTSLELGDAAAARHELNRAERLGADPVALLPLSARTDLAEGEHGQALERLDAALETQAAETQAPRPNGAQLLVLRGEALMGLGRLAEAEESFATALERSPGLASAHLGAARIHIAQQRTNEARTDLMAAVDADPKLHQAWELLGDLERSEGRTEPADEAYTQAIAHAPMPSPTHLKRGLARIAQTDLEGAAADLRALRRLGPNQAGTAYLEGVLRYQEERYADAQAALERALSTAPGFDPAVFFLGASHFAQGNWRAAEHHLGRYLSNNPTSADAARLLAQVRMREGDADGAAQLLQPVLGQNPDDVFALNLLGNIFIARGDHSEGIGHLRRMALAQPEDASVRAALASGLLRAGEQDAGLRELERALEQAPGEMQLEVSYIIALLQSQEFDAALRALDALDERMPDDSLPPNLRAAAYIGQEDFTRARSSLREALRRDPSDVAAASNLAQLALQTGDDQTAVQVFRDALQQNPGHPRLSLSLAQLEAGRGNIEEMQRLLEASLERHPDELQPRITLARLFLNRDEPRRALSTLEPARSTHGEDPRLLDTLALVQIAAGRNTQAIATLRTLTRMAPDTAGTHFRLGQAFEQVGSLRDAGARYRKTLELDGAHTGALGRLANVEFREGNVEEALAVARRLQDVSGFEGRGHAVEGEILALTGQPAQAAEAFRQAYRLAPSADVVLALARVEQVLGEQESAANRLDEWLADHPDDHAVRFHLAGLRLALGHNDAARIAYEDLVEVNPRNVAVLNNLAYIYQKEDDPRALDLAERARALAPESPEVAHTLGWILLEAGNLERALPLLERARDALEGDAEVRFHFASALLEAGETEKARSELITLLADFGDLAERSRVQTLLDSIQ